MLELNYVKLFFTFELQADLTDRYLLFSSRADFDAAFRRAIPCRRADCSGCRSLSSCPYPANFGQILARDPEAVRRHQKPPLPFVFEFPILPPPPNRGRTAACSLTLFGSAVQEVHRYLSAVEILLNGYRLAVTKVEAECPGGARMPVASQDQPELPLLSGLDPSAFGPLSPDRLSLEFLTPLKLVNEGRLLKSFAFSHFARALMRRVSSLAYYYEGGEPALDYRWLSRCSETVETVSSDCRFVSWGGRPCGIMGKMSFGGDLEPFHLMVQLGLATHLGKSASFGFGAYRLSP